MIFVTVGTNEARFERLVEAAGRIPGDEELVIQTGHCLGRPERAACVPFLDFDDMLDHARRARAVVCHAGVGSIMMSLSAGRRPVVMPRLAALGEAVDDHQVPLARRMAQDGLVLLVEDPADLPAAVAADGATAAIAGGGGTDLARELAGYLASVVPAPAGRRRRVP